MLLEELSRNKKAIVGFIIVALCIIYIISKNFLFRTILGRLLLVIGLVATTNCNKMLGVGSVIVICLAYSQMSNDFENMENPSSKTIPNSSSKTIPNSSSKTIPNSSSSNDNSSTSIPNTTTPDIATIEEKKRNMITGKKASSLPIPPKDSAKDVSGTSNVKESFLNFAPY
jgi:hypothetical protein